MSVPAIPQAKSSKDATTSSKAVAFIQLTVMLGFTIFLLFQLGLTTYIAQQSYEGRTVAAVSLTQPKRGVLPGLPLGSTCKTFYFYKPGSEVLEGVTYVPSACPAPAAEVEVAYNLNNPRDVVIPLNGRQELLLWMGVITAVGTLLLYLLSFINWRSDQELVDDQDPYMSRLNALTSREARTSVEAAFSLLRG